MSATQRIDDIINGLTPQAEPEKIEIESTKSEEISEVEIKSNEDEITSKEGLGAKETDEEDNKESDPIKLENIDTDEYGIEVPKAKTYSEEDVQRMIRDRLSRGHHAQPTQQQQAAIQQAAKGFEIDPNSTDSWEVQLKEFVKGTINEVQHEEKTRAWQREENERQSNFEVKFTTGMDKFPDFKDVVGKMPVTDSMMMAIRDMDSPATFIYAAAKLQPKELERIAAINDPFQQAKEMGRLDERMRKAKVVSKTSVPLKSTVSDVSSNAKPVQKKSIDSLIQSHAKSKLRATK